MRKKKIAEEMEQVLREIAKEKGIIIHRIAVDADHIHIFASLPFDLSVSKAMQYFKGGSSYRIFRRHPNFRLRYPKGHFWSCGYFSRSISNVTSKAVNNYIKNHDSASLNQTINSVKEEARQLTLSEYN